MKWLALILLLTLLGCTASNLKEVTIETGQKKISIFVEVADESFEQTKGLMFRESLQENQGMLFVFPDEQERSFWMKNMLIPLDIMFINKEYEIVDIHHAVVCREEPCPIYKSAKPAHYVLEVNANFAEKHGIQVGSKLRTY